MSLKKWNIKKPDKQTAKLLAEECNIDPFAALIACGRGIVEPDQLEQLIANEPLLCDPYEMIDMKRAADCINESIANGESIAIFGDYDCDGVVATTIMFDYLSSRGVTGLTYIPDRITEGYGMNKEAINYLHSQKVKLIITVDNGIACVEEIKYAKSLGIKTVIIDHHLPPEILPEAEAIVDPHRIDCPSSFKEVCGAVVAFKVICAVSGKEPEQWLYKYADLLAVATVGDVMPLIDENRSIVKAGLLKLKNEPNEGLAAIMVVANINRSSLTAGRIAFGIVPRINVAGRMGSALRALKLLCSRDISEALTIANEIDEDNSLRREIEFEMTKSADDTINNCGYNHDRIIVVANEEIHPGIVGIIASRFVEKYGKPTIVLRMEDGMAHGSGRSIAGINLFKAISSCEDLLTRFGGHELAAGVSLPCSNIDEFRRKINEYAASLEPVHAELSIDLKLNPAALSVDLAQSIKVLEPFGSGNPVPMFAIMQVKIERITALKHAQHMKMLFSKGGITFEAIYFGVYAMDFYYEVGDMVDLAVTLDTSFYGGELSLSVQIKAMKQSELDEEQVFKEKDNYDAFKTGLKYEAELLLPTREEAASVYKQIARKTMTDSKLEHIFLKELGFAKTKIAITAFEELNLIKRSYDRLSVNEGAPKTDLNNSKTYKMLNERVNNS